MPAGKLPSLSCRPAPPRLQAYGLAVAGLVTNSPHSLPSQQLVEQLQAAVAQLCVLLAKHPGCVGAAGARCPYALLAEEQQQPALVGWEVLETGLRSLVALLAASGPEGVNTPDRDGFTLLHRWAQQRARGAALGMGRCIAARAPGCPAAGCACMRRWVRPGT